MRADSSDGSNPPKLLASLSDSDQEFILRLVLASGSLKDLAQGYQVSYPTIRGRLDRLIEQLQGVLAGRPVDPMADLLAGLIEKGEVAPSAARAVLELHRREVQRARETRT